MLLCSKPQLQWSGTVQGRALGVVLRDVRSVFDGLMAAQTKFCAGCAFHNVIAKPVGVPARIPAILTDRTLQIASHDPFLALGYAGDKRFLRHTGRIIQNRLRRGRELGVPRGWWVYGHIGL